MRKTKDGSVVFKVSSLNVSHPEMSEFENVYFALNENLSSSEFKAKYARKKLYNDIRIVNSGGELELKLKDKKSIKNISASLVTIDNKGKIQEIKNTNTRIKRYNKRLKAREQKFNKDIVKGRTDNNEIKVSDPKQLSQYAFHLVKKSMNAEEKKMSYNEWVDYCKQTEKNRIEWIKQTNAEKLAVLANAEATGENLIQSLSLSGTGIYNCDQIQRLENPVEIFASYKTEENQKLKPKLAYILDKANNSVFQYDGYRGYGAGKIAFSKSEKAENTLLTVNDDGTVAIYKTADFKNKEFKNKSQFDFIVTKINSNYTSVSDLKALIGF